MLNSNNELNSSAELINDSIVVADEIIDVHMINDNDSSKDNEKLVTDNNDNTTEIVNDSNAIQRSTSRDKSVDSNDNEENICEPINGNVSSASMASPMDCSHSFENLDGKSSDFNSDAPGSFDNLDDLPERSLSIEIIQSTGKLDDTLEVCTIKGVFKESHSLDMLEFVDEGVASKASIKRHSRNRSITLATQPQFWKSVDVIYGSSPCGVSKPSDIDSQLQCYDEALRQLAKVNIQKPTPPESRKEMSRASSFKQSSQDSVDEVKESVQMKDVAVSGPSSLETDRDDSFPPPPVYFMEGEENEIVELPGGDSTTMPFPISMLTPIKENYLEQDSLSAVEPGDNDSIDEAFMKNDIDIDFHSDPGTSKVELPPGKISASLHYPNIIPCHLDGGDLFLTDKDLSRYYPNFVEINTLHLQNESRSMQEGVQKSPSKLQRTEKVRSTDYESIPKFDIGGACLGRVNEVLKKRKELIEGTQDDGDEDESDDSKDDPPFWVSGKVGACLSRQNTVISVDGSTPTSAHLK